MLIIGELLLCAAGLRAPTAWRKDELREKVSGRALSETCPRNSGANGMGPDRVVVGSHSSFSCMAETLKAKAAKIMKKGPVDNVARMHIVKICLFRTNSRMCSSFFVSLGDANRHKRCVSARSSCLPRCSANRKKCTGPEHLCVCCVSVSTDGGNGCLICYYRNIVSKNDEWSMSAKGSFKTHAVRRCSSEFSHMDRPNSIVVTRIMTCASTVQKCSES